MNDAISAIQSQIESLQLKIDEASGLLSDPSLADLVKQEVADLNSQKEALEASINPSKPVTKLVLMLQQAILIRPWITPMPLWKFVVVPEVKKPSFLPMN
jgi:hypothetical protein